MSIDLFGPVPSSNILSDYGRHQVHGSWLHLVKSANGNVMELKEDGKLQGVAPSAVVKVFGAPDVGDYGHLVQTMSPRTFDAIAKLLRSPPSGINSAVRAVLVDGQGVTDSARQFEVFPQSVSRSVQAFRAALELAIAATVGA